MAALKIKNPKSHHVYGGELDSFILAAQTASLRPACELLLIHAGDLAWTKNAGSLLYRIDLGDDALHAIEMTEARTKVGAMAFARSFWPLFEGMMREIAGKYGEVMDPDKDDEWNKSMAALAGANAARHMRDQPSKLAGINLQDIIPLLIDGLSGLLAREAISLRQRQLAALGMDEQGYDDMVSCLERLDGHCTPMARVAFARDSLHPELGLCASAGFRVTALEENAHVIEILRVSQVLDRLKRGEDKALPVFIAALINRQLPVQQEAYACARYGNKDDAEFDVVIPKLSVGMEIKLYQGRGVMTPDRIATAAQDLSRQLKHYFAFGFQRIYYVSNLANGHAREVLALALQHSPRPDGVKVQAVGGDIEDIIRLADKLAGKLTKLVNDALQKMTVASYQRARVKVGQSPRQGTVEVPGSAVEEHTEPPASARDDDRVQQGAPPKKGRQRPRKRKGNGKNSGQEE